MTQQTATQRAETAPAARREPRVLAIIINWNKKDWLDRVLEAVQKLERPPDEILVVDNASSDGSAEMVSGKHPRAHLLRQKENLGGSGGFNAGLRWGLERGGFDYFWLLDNDVILHPEALSALLAVAESDPRIGQVGSRIAYLGQPRRTQEAGVVVDWRRCVLQKIGAEEDFGPPGAAGARVFDADYAAACSLLARVEAIRDVGIWDSEYFIYYDDMEWGVRMKRAGWKVKATTGSMVEHEGFYQRRSTQGLATRYLDIRNCLFFYHKFCPPPNRLRGFFHLYRRLLTDLFHFLREGNRGMARCLWLAAWDFLRGRRGPNRHTFAPPASARDSAAAAAKIPNRKGRVLAIAYHDTPQTTRLLERARELFPGRAVDTLVPTDIEEMERFAPENLIRRPAATWRDRLALAGWALRRYDAVARVEDDPSFAFEALLPARVRVAPSGEARILPRRLGALCLTALAKPFAWMAAAAFALAAWLKPVRQVDYFPWRRESTTEGGQRP